MSIRQQFLMLIALFAPGFTCGADQEMLPKTIAKLRAHQPLKIVCLGDSVTGIYYHTGGRRAYPEMVEIGLKQLDPAIQVTVVNAGISGNSTVDALNRLQKDVLDQQPDLVTVMFGLNDIVRVPAETFTANLKEIAARCRAISAEVMFCTPNGIYPTPGRPVEKLEEYNSLMKAVAAETKSAFCDIYSSYQSVKKTSEQEFRLLCSDPFHPNMDGHKLNAELICETIAGRKPKLASVGPPSALSHVQKKLAAGQPIHIYAMTPFDQWIGDALKTRFPGANISVTPWKADGQTIAQLHEASKGVRGLMPRPDLVVLAIPLEVTPALSKPEDAAWSDYVWTMNFALSFGIQEWDVVAVSPSVLKAKLTDEEREREDVARRLIRAQHLDLIARPDDHAGPPIEVLSDWLRNSVN